MPSSPLIEGDILLKDHRAQQMHQAGLSAELHGQYEAALVMLESAEERLLGMPQTVDVTVQRAQVVRDRGFTFVREAIGHQTVSGLQEAQDTIAASASLTAPLVSGAQRWHDEPQHPVSVRKRIRREILAEHGATISLLGRVATVETVMYDEAGRSRIQTDQSSHQAIRHTYGLAHRLLRQGNNGYYRVSNTMVAARQERLNGNLPYVALWLGRAAVGLVWTAGRNRHNFMPAVRTAGNRVRHLRSHAAARSSVLEKP